MDRSGGWMAGFPWLTAGLTAAIVVIWGAMAVTGGGPRATEDAELLYRWGAAARPLLIEEGEHWRLLTAGFLHIGLPHLLMNSFSLWWVGQVAEPLFGRGRMLLIYLLALVAGSAASLALGPPVVLSAGASGAIFGLLGALVWYRLAAPERHRLRHVPLLAVVLLNVGYGLLNHDAIDNWNHLGGLAGGFIAAAAVGVPGTGPGRGRRLLHGAASLLLALLAAAAVSGAVSPSGPSQRLVEALEAWEDGRLDEAAATMEGIAARYADVRFELALGWIYFEQGRFDEAERAAGRVLRTDPGNPEALELLHAIRYFTGGADSG